MNTKMIIKWAAAATLACITMNMNALAETTLISTLINDTFPATSSAGGKQSASGGDYVRIKYGYNSPSIVADSIAGVNSLQLRPDTAESATDNPHNNSQQTLFRAFNGGQTLTLSSLSEGQGISISLKVDFNTRETGGGLPVNNIGNLFFGLTGWNGGMTGSNYTPGTNNVSLIGAKVGSSGGTLAHYDNAYLGATNVGDPDATGTILGSWSSVPNTGILYTLSYTITKGASDYALEYLVNGTSVFSANVDLSAYENILVNGLSLRLADGNMRAYISQVDVSTFATVPEPSTWMLLGSSVALLAFLRRRK